MSRWRAFRKYLDTITLDEAINETNEFWNSCPYTPFYLDIDTPDIWPDPWQLLEENYYCDIAKCLGIIYTLCLTKHKASIEFELRQYESKDDRTIYNLAWLNQGKYVLNFSNESIVNNTSITEKLKLKRVLGHTQLRLDQY